jgi:hypothetical protein
LNTISEIFWSASVEPSLFWLYDICMSRLKNSRWFIQKANRCFIQLDTIATILTTSCHNSTHICFSRKHQQVCTD